MLAEIETQIILMLLQESLSGRKSRNTKSEKTWTFVMNPQNLFITLFTCVDILNKKILSESPFFIYECKGEKKNSSSRLRPSKERKVSC